MGKLCTALKRICVAATFFTFAVWMVYLWGDTSVAVEYYGFVKKITVTYGFMLVGSYIIYLIENPPRHKKD